MFNSTHAFSAIDTCSTAYYPGAFIHTPAERIVHVIQEPPADYMEVCSYCNTEWQAEDGKVGTCCHCGGNVRKRVKIQIEEE